MLNISSSNKEGPTRRVRVQQTILLFVFSSTVIQTSFQLIIQISVLIERDALNSWKAPMAEKIILPPSTLSTMPLTSSFISGTQSFPHFTLSFNLQTTFKSPRYHTKPLWVSNISMSLNPSSGDSASTRRNRWSLHGKTALVTGGTRGIGYKTILSKNSTYICTHFVSSFVLWSLM